VAGTAIVAAFPGRRRRRAVPRANLPWPLAGATRDRLARVDGEEPAAPAERAAEGARLAEAVGFVSRAVGIPAADVSGEEEDAPRRPLLRHVHALWVIRREITSIV
jgi:hypothetical protein